MKPEIRPFPDEWLRHFDETQLERLAIMTVDGGLTDAEALEAMDQAANIVSGQKIRMEPEPVDGIGEPPNPS